MRVIVRRGPVESDAVVFTDRDQFEQVTYDARRVVEAMDAVLVTPEALASVSDSIFDLAYDIAHFSVLIEGQEVRS
jgi:hypothetical protein